MELCDEYEALMSLVLDGEADPDQEAALSAHLARCPACAALFEELNVLHAGAEGLLVKAPESLKDNIMAALAAESARAPRQKARKRPAARWRSYAAMAAVFALAVGVGARQTLFSANSPTPAAQDIVQPADAARSGGAAGQEPAPQSAESAGGAPPANTESAGGGSFKSAQPICVPDSAQSGGLTDLRAAMELVVERVCGESGYTLETDYVMNLHGLAPYCTFRLLDGEAVVEEGQITFTGLSPNGRYRCFLWTWEGQSGEEAALFRYAVPLDAGGVIWAGEAAEPAYFDRALTD